MDSYFGIYVAAWGSACVVALIIYLRERASYPVSRPDYWRFLATPWRLATFAVAGGAITFMAPYTSDPTWDCTDGLFMSVLAFTTAPWTVGTIYRVLRGRLPFRQAYVACCVWLFSASWSYDLYILLRDGLYPPTWFPNIFASSVLYVSAGLLWSLDWKDGRGAIFSFMEDEWPPSNAARTPFRKIWWVALPFIAIVVALTVPFLLPGR